MKHKTTIYTKLLNALAYGKFFYVIIGLFVVQGLWIAFTGRYPMAFDEMYHLGVIKLHAQQLSPFFEQQPIGGDEFGALTRDTSIFYHYIMSFPYRLSHALFQSEFIDVMMIRMCSVGFVAAALVVFRKILGFTKAPPAIIHAAMLFFVLTPLVPFEVAQMNYDNLMILGTSISLYACLRFWQVARTTNRFDMMWFLVAGSAVLFTSLTKYAFLPIAFIVSLYMVGVIYALCRRVAWRRVFVEARQAFGNRSRWLRFGLVGIFLLLLVSFAKMDGYNLVRYGTPQPECDQVMSIERCKSFGSWAWNYRYLQEKKDVDPNPLTFTASWWNRYFYSHFFLINGIFSGFVNRPAMPIAYITALVVFCSAVICALVWSRRIFADPVVRFLGVVSIFLIITLWLKNYATYIHLGRHLAEQGRYVLPVLLPLYFIGALALSAALGKAHRARMIVFGVVLFLFLQGGGIVSYLARTDSGWWFQNNAVSDFTEGVQKVVKPLVFE